MLTGRRAFEGDDISITLAAVLKDDVAWKALPADLPTPLTFDPAADNVPVWNPDGKRIAFVSNRDGGVFNLCVKDADGPAADELLLKTPHNKVINDWSALDDGVEAVDRPRHFPQAPKPQAPSPQDLRTSMTDSHCHIAGEEFVADLDAVVERAKAAGVSRALVILAAEDDTEIARVPAVLAAWPECRFAVGVHPHHAHLFAADPAAAAALVERRLDGLPTARAIGEIGLDYHYDFSPREVQHAVFRAQLQLARSRDLPVVIHTREAEDDTLRILAEEGGTALRGVFHCFTGDAAAATRALATGFYLSIPGVISFPKAEPLRVALPQVPADRLLVETDSPYLAPVPHRGKRNEPAYVAKVVDHVAAARASTRAEMGAATDRNFDALFRP